MTPHLFKLAGMRTVYNAKVKRLSINTFRAICLVVCILRYDGPRETYRNIAFFFTSEVKSDKREKLVYLVLIKRKKKVFLSFYNKS